MEKTQNSLRKRICLIGEANVGKSSLLNALLKEAVSIVSPVEGTTTDNVTRAYELLGVGPVLFCDTAGIGEETETAPTNETMLNKQREEATLRALKISDAVLIIRAKAENTPADDRILSLVQAARIPYLIVYNKTDLYTAPEKAIAVSAKTKAGIDQLTEALKKLMANSATETLLEGLVKKGDHILLVAPIDSSAPKGRLILPQVQAIRECLDRGALTTVVQPEQLETAMKKQSFDLIITDSKVVREVLQQVPETQRVTTFSVLFAAAKGNFDVFCDGCRTIDTLADNDKILIAEACVHTTNEDDIAKAMIPKLLQKRTGKTLQIDFASGKNFPENLSEYRLVIQCGGCMLTRKEMLSRIEIAQQHNVPITNYGLTITHCQTGNIFRLSFAK